MSDSKTATKRLRELLDERGVAHSDHYLSTTWRDGHGILHLAGEPMADGSLVVDMLTPEQAIAATLGSGECEKLKQLVRDILDGDPRCTNRSCGDCEHDTDDGCGLVDRAVELGAIERWWNDDK